MSDRQARSAASVRCSECGCPVGYIHSTTCSKYPEVHKRSAATTCEHGYTGDERDSCACPTCSEQQLLAKVKELTALLREFEELPVRRLTNETAVYERSPLDAWRARCGEAVHGWL